MERSSLRLSRMAHEYILKYGLNRRSFNAQSRNFKSDVPTKEPWFTQTHFLIAG